MPNQSRKRGIGQFGIGSSTKFSGAGGAEVGDVWPLLVPSRGVSELDIVATINPSVSLFPLLPGTGILLPKLRKRCSSFPAWEAASRCAERQRDPSLANALAEIGTVSLTSDSIGVVPLSELVSVVLELVVVELEDASGGGGARSLECRTRLADSQPF